MIDNNFEPAGHIFEHPFNERMRLLLRLEIIFAQAIKYKTAKDQYETQLCLDSLFALLNLTNRYELRAELLRELERIRNMLTQLQRIEEVSDDQITQTLIELGRCTEVLHSLDSKHIDRMRNIEFLNTVKNRNVHETGSYLFELPALQHWLMQPSRVREQQIHVWLDDFMPLKTAIDFLLRLIRESTEQEEVVAENGVYIKKVDGRSSTHQLLRIILPEEVGIYPRVSGDKYRFAVRFMSQKFIDSRAVQTNEDVKFVIHGCGI